MISPCQIANLLIAWSWWTFTGAYFEPVETMHSFLGQDYRPTNFDMVNEMALGAYCIFFGLTCAVASVDRKASQLNMTVQGLMSAFFLHFHYTVTPTYKVGNHQTAQEVDEGLQYLRHSWGAAVAIAVVALALDLGMGTKTKSKKEE